MNTRLIALIAAACVSSISVAQTNSTQPTDRTAANSGEQNSATMQNNSNAQNTTQGKNHKDRKMHKTNKNKVDCNEAHTDGNATTPATTARADCDNTTKVQR